MPAACSLLFESPVPALLCCSHGGRCDPLPCSPTRRRRRPLCEGHGCSWKGIPVPLRPLGSDGGSQDTGGEQRSWRARPALWVCPSRVSRAGVRGLTGGSPRAAPGSALPAPSAAAGGRAAGRRLAGVCQQAGHAQRHGGERADRQAGAADAAQQDREWPGAVPTPVPAGGARGGLLLGSTGLAICRAQIPFFSISLCFAVVRAGNVRNPGHGALRRAGLAIARALQALAGPAARGPDEPGASLPTAVSFGFLCFIWGGRGCFPFLPRVASSLCLSGRT